MKKREFSINYQKKWSPSGACYKQTININCFTFGNLRTKLESEIKFPIYSKKNDYRILFLKQPLVRVGNIVFMNLKQRDFFNIHLGLKLLDVNTCFCVIK
jgi:hypothetical protein